MDVKQIYKLVNDISSQILGDSIILEEDLSNLVDVGNAIQGTDNVDNYVNKLVHHIGKVVFDDRKYTGNVPSVLMDSWEFGSVMQRIGVELFEAQENDTWKLVDGQSYDANVFHQPDVHSSFYDSKVTFEIPVSFAERQVKDSFSNATQMNGFLSMITTAVDNSMSIKLDELIMRTLNNMTANALLAENGVTRVNLLALYNDTYGQKLKANKALNDRDFLLFANGLINTYSDRLSKISTLFNVKGKARFSPKSKQHIVMLSDFMTNSDNLLRANVMNKELTEINGVKVDTVPYWQGSGTNYEFNDISAINVKANDGSGTAKTVNQSGIVGIMFDRNAVGVSNLDRRVTTNYNAKAEFYTNFYKADSSYYNDLSQNYVAFVIQDVDTGA